MFDNKTIYGCTISFIIALVFVSGCSSANNTSNEISNSTKKITNIESTAITKPVDSEEEDSTKTIDDFIKSIKSNDAEALKRIISPSGLIIIRNFSSGNGARGKDIRNLYLADKIPTNLQFEISGEAPVILSELFKRSQEIEIKNITVESINGNNFNFKDDSKNNMFAPPTEEVIDICGEITSTKDTNNQYNPKIFNLEDKEIVLTESALVADSPVGVWAIFEKANNKYFIKSVIDLR